MVDPEGMRDGDIVTASIVARIVFIHILFMTAVAVWVFLQRLRSRTHHLTILGFAGSASYLGLLLVGTAIAEEIDGNRHFCESRVRHAVEFGVEAMSVFLMQLHLLLKARVARKVSMKTEWSWMYIIAVIFLLFIPATALWGWLEEWPVHLHYDPIREDFSGWCAMVDLGRAPIARSLVLMGSNILCCLLFLDALFVLVTGDVESLGWFCRAKVMLMLIFRGQEGIKYLPKNTNILTTQLGPVQSFSTRGSVQALRDTKIILARRSFIAVVTKAVVNIAVTIPFLLQHHIPWLTPLFGLDPAASWALTALACPTPQERAKPPDPEPVEPTLMVGQLLDVREQSLSRTGFHAVPVRHREPSSPSPVVVPHYIRHPLDGRQHLHIPREHSLGLPIL